MRGGTLLLLVALIGCGSPPSEVDVSDVIEVTACRVGEAVCARVADGRSRITVHVGTKVAERRKSEVPVKLSLTAGQWEEHDPDNPRTTTVDLAAAPARDVVFVAPNRIDPIAVRADLFGFVATDTIVLGPASLGAVDLTSTPATLPVDRPATLTIAAAPRVLDPPSAVPTVGSLVTFEVVSAEGGTTILWPTRRQVIEETVETTLTVGTGVTQVVVKTTVSPVMNAEGVSGPTQSQTLTLSTLE